jgi:acyl-[acyl-carrier-protein]-phospholipid O-acyltransferase/long-chain-fatty-acid--[acyl-carrier-protein] ligase
LRTPWRDQEAVGILLPASMAAALVNIAAALSGRVSVNLNFTAGREALASAARQAHLTTVVTSREFLDKAGVELPDGVTPIWIEEVAGAIGGGSRLVALLLALLSPVRLLERACGARRRTAVDDIATIIFSSGSTGEPKGVLLSHFNIASNVEASAQVFRTDPSDRILGILPLFHSFGYMSLWFALNRRMGIVFHPNPVDAASIGALVQRYRVTFLLATPTFLQVYLRRCTPAQFGSLRLVLTGAEKLNPRVAQAFEDQFGIRPLEGYGTTECAPAVAVSVPDFRAPGFYQPGSRRGFVGQPLPGVSIRIVDPDSRELLEPGNPGMLLVKGPNVMKGYLGREDLSAGVMQDGWYVTGDIAVMDEDGFLRITDRLSRFSKIGGEMVPHGRIEEALQEAAGATIQVFAVTAVPDERKGERLAVLHTLDKAAIPPLLDKLAASGLPNLFIPRRDGFVKVEALPVLGTGKLDLRAIKEVAAERLQPAG